MQRLCVFFLFFIGAQVATDTLKWNPRNWFQLLGASYHIETTQQHSSSFFCCCCCFQWRTLIYSIYSQRCLTHKKTHVEQLSRSTIYLKKKFVFYFSVFEINLYYTNHFGISYNFHLIFRFLFSCDT